MTRTATHVYASPMGPILLAADGEGLVALDCLRDAPARDAPGTNAALRAAVRWLDVYFSGRDPGFTPPLHLSGTPFREAVWRLLLDIPYGGTTTYGALARALSARGGAARMAAQAVGGAVGKNPVAIIVPCHRVIGADGGLTGYAGGLDRKARLLALEGLSVENGKCHAKVRRQG